MLKKIMLLGILSVAIVACGGNSENSSATVKVKSLQKNDKNLSCREILLEMNEAQFYNRMAHKNRGVKLKNVLMPLGYISTYMDSEDAIGAAQARVEYLDRIYEIMHCEDQEKELEKLPVFKGEKSGGGAKDDSEEDRGSNYRDELRGRPHSQSEGGYNKYSDGGSVRYYLEQY